MNRREFLTAGAAFAAGFGFDKSLWAGVPKDFHWAYMVQFGMNMWGDLAVRPERNGIMTKHLTDAEFAEYSKFAVKTTQEVCFDEELWRELSARLRTNGCTTLVVDLGGFVVYPSHPELALKGSWSAERLQAEVRRLKAMGFEVVPKLNFSTCHDAWLKDYARMVSTQKYYQVAADVIRDAYEIFDRPNCVHLGMDEEDILSYQSRNTSLVRMRQTDLWWHDFGFFVGEVEKHGARAWVWSDYLRRHKVEEFLAKMPKSVIQSPWTYWSTTPTFEDPLIKIFKTLADNGYDVVPCGSNCYGVKENFPEMAKFCQRQLPAEHFKGMIFAPWMATMPAWRRLLTEGADIFGQAVRALA